MEDTITLTQAELDAKIQEAVDTATKDLVSKHNQAIAGLRKENKDLKDASKSHEQIAQEQDEAIKQELNDLRAYKKGKLVEERLAKENLPSFFKNDSRLLNADDEAFEKALKEVKREYEATLPKGNTHSSIVQTSTSGSQPQMSEKDKANAEFSQALKQLVANR